MQDKLKAAWEWFGGLPQLFRVGLTCLFAGFVIGGLTCRTWRKTFIEDEPPVGDSAPLSMGWVDNPDRVTKVVAGFSQPFFGDSAKPLIQAAKDENAFLWQAYEKVRGKPWEPHDQGATGSCVAQGLTGALEILTCVEIALGENSQEYRDLSAAISYGFAREIGDFLGNQDGSTGADGAAAAMKLGSLSCEEAGDDNRNPKIGAALCKKWGRTGVPSEHRAAAKNHLLKLASRVRTPEEGRAALVNGYTLTIACSVGFNDSRGNVAERDAEGRVEPRGTWNHQQFVSGYWAEKKWFLVQNSWGNLPRGPKAMGQPDGSYWVTWQTMQRMIQSGECYALSGFEGFKSRDLDWRVQLPARTPRHLAALRIFDFPLAY